MDTKVFLLQMINFENWTMELLQRQKRIFLLESLFHKALSIMQLSIYRSEIHCFSPVWDNMEHKRNYPHWACQEFFGAPQSQLLAIIIIAIAIALAPHHNVPWWESRTRTHHSTMCSGASSAFYSKMSYGSVLRWDSVGVSLLIRLPNYKYILENEASAVAPWHI